MLHYWKDGVAKKYTHIDTKKKGNNRTGTILLLPFFIIFGSSFGKPSTFIFPKYPHEWQYKP